ncbi:MAG: hypothetical protein ACD_21C00286G0001, partial [uncultured bacterium]
MEEVAVYAGEYQYELVSRLTSRVWYQAEWLGKAFRRKRKIY